jgi:hypothetical protein
MRYVGEGLRPAADAQRIREAPGVTVLDDGTHMLLVETSPKRLKELMDSLPGWIWTPERSIRLPDPRPRPRRKPGD